MNNKINIIGTTVGANHFSDPLCLKLIIDAQIIAGSKDILTNCSQLNPHACQLAISSHLNEFITKLKTYFDQGKSIVILTNGDPLFFSIGTTLLRHFSSSELNFFPGISSLQTACARLGLAWSDISTISLHGRNNWTKLATALQTHEHICILGDINHTALKIAHWLEERGIDWLEFHIFNNLNTPQEGYVILSLEQALCYEHFDPAPTMILKKIKLKKNLRFGLHQKLQTEQNLQTKLPIRAGIMACLGLSSQAIFWDIGSGSGSIAFEAACLAWQGQIFALEQNPDRVQMLHENRKALGAANVDIVLTTVPSGLADLPDPHAVFIGGGLSGETGLDILDYVLLRLKPEGKLVISCVLLNTLEKIRTYCKEKSLHSEILSLSASKSQELGQDIYLKAHNTVYIVTVNK